MRTYDPHLPLISLHIPKCGGTSFDYVLKQWFGKKLLHHYYNRRLGTFPKKHSLRYPLLFWVFKSGICIHGHFNQARGFGVDDYYPGTQQFITIMRDPFDHAVSLYLFVQALKPQSSGITDGNLVPSSLSLEEFLMNKDSTIPLYFPRGMNPGNYIEFIESNFIYIGLLETLQSSVDTLARRLNKSHITIPHFNKNDRKNLIANEASMRKLYRERNSFAYMLYDYAREHLSVNELSIHEMP